MALLALVLGTGALWAEAGTSPIRLEPGEPLEVALDHELSPRRGVPTGWRTEVGIKHDGQSLIVEVLAYDPEPERIVEARGQRDAITGDLVTLRIDPRGDGTRAFVLGVNAAGAVSDAIASSRGQASPGWNGRWDADASVEAWGFRVRYVVPLATVEVKPDPAGEARIGIAVRRRIGRGRQELLGWPKVDIASSCPDCAIAQITLSGVEAAPSAWRILPTLTSTRNERFHPLSGERIERVDRLEAGVDVRYTPGPGRHVLLTLNPDFSQVQIDSLQIEANRRFAITQIERRPFFTENAGAFGSRSITPLYTRTITEPTWGIQGVHALTKGQVAALLADDVRTSLILPGTSRSQVVSLERASRNAAVHHSGRWGDHLHHGVFASHRRADGYANSLVSGTARWEQSARSAMTLELAGSDTRNPVEWQSAHGVPARQSGAAGRALHMYSGEVYSAVSSFGETGSDFRADLAALGRVGVRRASHGSDWAFERDPEARRVSSWWFGTSANALSDLDDRLLQGGVDAYFGLGYRNGASLSLGHGSGREREGATLFPARMSYLNAFAPLGARVRFDAGVSRGDSVDFDAAEPADLDSHSASLAYTGRQLRASMSVVREHLRVAGETRYRATAGSGQLTWTPGNRHQVRLIVSATSVDAQGAETRHSFAGQVGYRYQRDAHTAFTLGLSSRAAGPGAEGELVETGRYLFSKLSLGF